MTLDEKISLISSISYSIPTKEETKGSIFFFSLKRHHLLNQYIRIAVFENYNSLIKAVLTPLTHYFKHHSFGRTTCYV